MTPPMTPREKVRQIIDDALNSAIPEPWEVANHAADRVLTALASGSGDHAELEVVAWRVQDLILPQQTFTTDEAYARHRADYRYEGEVTATVEPLVTAASAEALLAENAALRGERDDADRRAGAAERELEGKSDSISKRERWLRNAKEARGYHQNISFDRVWAETCAAADRATEAERKLAEARAVIDEISETAQITRVRHLARTFLSKEDHR